MIYEEELIKEEIAVMVNAFLMVKIRTEGNKVFSKIAENLQNVIYNVLERGFVDEIDALSIFGYVAY